MSVPKHILDTVLQVQPIDILHPVHGLALFPSLPVVVLSSYELRNILMRKLDLNLLWGDWIDARAQWVASNGCTLAQVPRKIAAEEVERLGEVYRIREHGMPFILLEEV